MAFITTAAGAFIAGSALTAGASAYGAYKSGQSADQALSSQEDQLAIQNRIAQEQWDLSKEQWSMYKENIWPLELEAQKMGIDAQELALQRGKIDYNLYQDYYAPLQEDYIQSAIDGVDVEKRKRDARIATNEAFDVSQGMVQRDLSRRGVRPGSGNYNDAVGDTSLSRSATQAWNVRQAVEGADTENFNRMGAALGRQPAAANPTQNAGSPAVNAATAGANLSNAAAGFGRVGNTYGNLAGMYGNAAASGASSAIQLGAQAYDTYNKYFGNGGVGTGGGVTSYGNNMINNANSSNIYNGSSPALNYAFAEGGPVNAPPALDRGAPNGGMVSGPPGLDRVPAQIIDQSGQPQQATLTNNEYVIPEDVVKAVGTDEFDEIIERTRMRKQKAMQGPNSLNRRMH